MELVAVLGCAVFSWCAGFVLVPARTSPSTSSLRLRRVWQRVRDVLGALSSLHLVAFLSARPAWRHLASTLAKRLVGKGLDLTVEEGVAALVVGFAGAFLGAALLSRSVVGSSVVVGACIIGVHALESSRERRRANALAEEMPGIFRTLAIAIGSGQTLSQAIDYVGSHETGPAAEEFARTSLRLRCGISAEEALSLMVDELDAPGVGLLVTALLISQRTGSPLRDLFQRSARLVERQGEFERTLSVKTAQVRLSVRIVCLLPVLMIAILSLISPDFQKGLSTVAGAGSVLLALGMDAAALVIIRRLLKGVL